MENITLEKVDAVIERTYVTYAEAKEALETCNGDVLEAIIYLEDKIKKDANEQMEKYSENKNETIAELKAWLKKIIEKGDVTRLKIKKDDKVLADVPVNAGIAAAVIAVIIPPILAFGIIAAVATQITIEITKADGSVEVVNKYISKAGEEVKSKASSISEKIKNKLKKDEEKETVYKGNNTSFSYTVNFDDENEDK